jgi:hypothetical protein
VGKKNNRVLQMALNSVKNPILTAMSKAIKAQMKSKTKNEELNYSMTQGKIFEMISGVMMDKVVFDLD